MLSLQKSPLSPEGRLGKTEFFTGFVDEIERLEGLVNNLFSLLCFYAIFLFDFVLDLLQLPRSSILIGKEIDSSLPGHLVNIVNVGIVD